MAPLSTEYTQIVCPDLCVPNCACMSAHLCSNWGGLSSGLLWVCVGHKRHDGDKGKAQQELILAFAIDF